MLSTVFGVLVGGGATSARFSVWWRPLGRVGVSRCRWPAADGVAVGLKGVEEPEEGAEPGVPCLYSPSDLAGVSDDLAGDVDEGLLEGAELHGQQLAALLEVLVGPAGSDGQEEGAPGFDAPGEAGHGHVGPVGAQGVDRGVEGSHGAFELGVEVLLVAAGSGLGNDLVGAHGP